MSERETMFGRIRSWRLRRAERKLRDYAWRVKEWGYPGVYPSEKDAAKRKYHRLIRRVYALGGEPLDVQYVGGSYVSEAIPGAYEHRPREQGNGWEVVRV